MFKHHLLLALRSFKRFKNSLFINLTGLSTGGLYHIQTNVDISLGDLNADGSWNVLDIVVLANCILIQTCGSLEYGCAGDLNYDGALNILDLVTLVNCALAENCGR